MRVKVLSAALLAAIIALPVPASQMLAGLSVPSGADARNPGFWTLIEDPFLIDRMSFEAPRAFSAEEPA